MPEKVNELRNLYTSYILKVNEEARIFSQYYGFVEFIQPIHQSNRKLANLLSAFRTFDDQLAKYLSDQCGKQSNEYKEYSIARKKIYDNNSSYRFFSLLRNYVQHFGLPITGISYSNNVSKTNQDTGYKIIELQVSRKDLLRYNGWKDWKNVLSNPLAKNEMVINAMLNEFVTGVIELYKYMVSVLESDFKKSRELLLKIYNEGVEDSSGTHDDFYYHALTMFIICDNSNISDRWIHLPINQLRHAEKLRRKHRVSEKQFLTSFSIFSNIEQ